MREYLSSPAMSLRCPTEKRHQDASSVPSHSRRVIFILLSIALALLFLVLLSLEFSGISEPSPIHSLLRRGDNSIAARTTSTESRTYLIIIFVVFALAAIILTVAFRRVCFSRASLRNPWCCPCYVFACCGGILCLQAMGINTDEPKDDYDVNDVP
ncbi:hypothetical protein BD410DRAFT_164957 [Rickenella mellea]|uniref:Uncharacterized protein n=1 Tax=Rickenella mellea TaxID=50990 RepID=A0A4Y7Q9K3_9AGAM|nr:hypothetical protein BD410DRAFT_164957 [Rickenella mellea]